MKNNNIKIIAFFLFFGLIGCVENKIKTVDMGNYKIEIPTVWKKISLKGIDSEVQIIITQKGDTIFSDFGGNSEMFNETNKVFSKNQIQKYKGMGMQTKDLFWSITPDIDQAQGTFLNEFYMYEFIDNCRAKLRVPKKEGKGITGVSIDSIFKSSNRLTITAKNLDKSEQDILVKSFYSIKFNSK